MLAGVVKVELAVVQVMAEVVLAAAAEVVLAVVAEVVLTIVAEVVLAVLLVVAVRALATKVKTETTLLQTHLRLRQEKGLVVYHCNRKLRLASQQRNECDSLLLDVQSV